MELDPGTLPARRVPRDHDRRRARGVQPPARDRHAARRCAAGAARPRPARRLQDQPDPLEQDPPRPQRRPRAVRRAADGRRPRARDRGVRAAGVLDDRRAASRSRRTRTTTRSPRASPACPARGRRRSAAASRPSAIIADLRPRRLRRARRKEEAAAPPARRRRSRRARCSRRRRAASASPRSARWRVAQQLYEGLNIPGEGQVGLITYMRTDSLNIAQVARDEARGYIAQPLRRRLRAGRAAVLQDEVEGRAGGARGDPADVRVPRPGRRPQVADARTRRSSTG